MNEPTKDEIEEYINGQITSGLKMGDIVRITRIAKTHERGWPNSWTPTMDSFVYKTGKLIAVDKDGFGLDTNKLIKGYRFPFFVLEKIE